MPPIRVLHVIGSLGLGGSQAFVMNLYRNIDRSVVQFDFATKRGALMDYRNEIESLGGKVYELATLEDLGAANYLKQWRRFLEQHKEFSILHSHIRSTAIFYIPLAKKNGLFTIAHSHNISDGKSSIKNITKRFLEFPLRYVADDLFACTNDAARWLFGSKAFNNGRVYIVKNAIEVDKFRYSKFFRDELRKELGADEHTLVVGHIGRFVYQKNHEFLINVFKEIMNIQSDAKLLLIGSGEDERRIDGLISDYGLSDNVVRFGTRTDVYKCLQAMDVFLFPSRAEGLGIVLIEAQASGLKCVASDVIPQEAFVIKELSYPMSLGTPCKEWAIECVKAGSYNRTEASKEIKLAGYDVQSNAANLESYYIEAAAKAHQRQKSV